MRARKKKQMEKLNLIPILDAIFIFIFFLLMSAQFIDIYELNSDAPIVSSSEEVKDKKKPLNLSLVLNRDTITITKGLDNIVYKKFSLKELDKFNKELIKIKTENPKETSAILKPSNSFPYEKIVTVIDHTRQIKQKGVLVTSVDSQNKETKSNKLFDQIIFETMD